MKKLVCLLLSLALLIGSTVSIGAANINIATTNDANGKCGENLTWTYDSNSKTLTISGTGAMEEFEIHDAPWIQEELEIKKVVIEEGVTSIGEGAFKETGVAEISLPQSLGTIGGNAFCCCMSLKDVVLPSNLTRIRAGAFQLCFNLGNITIPASVMFVDSSAFEECENMKEITFLNPDCEIYYNTTTIYEETTIYGAENSTAQAYAEKYNRNFVAIEIESPDTNGSCGENLSWSYNDSTSTLTISGSGEMTDYDYNANLAPWSIYPIESIIIQSGVTNIGDSAFANLKTLTEISIPETVVKIGTYAFRECESIKNIELPANLTTIGESAFSGCRSLENFSIPSGVTTLPVYAFGSCQSIKNIYIPNTLTNIHIDAFQGCAGVLSIIVDSNNPVYDSRDNCNAIIQTQSNTLFLGCKSTIIPKTVTAIGNNAFDIDFGPSYLVIPGNVKTIGKSAFYSCRIKSLTIEEGVEIIGDYAFAQAQDYDTITIPKSVKSIGNCAFGFAMIKEFIILNPECEIYDHPYTLPNLASGTTIYGFEGSTTQAYAEKYNRNFKIYVEPEYILGDTDLDGKLSVLDATEIQRVIAKLKDWRNDSSKSVADVDKDGTITVLDATAIQRKLAKLD